MRFLAAFALAFSVAFQGMAATMVAPCPVSDHDLAVPAGHHHDNHTHDADPGAAPEADAGNAPGSGHCLASATISSFAQVPIPEAAAAPAIAASSRSPSGIQPDTPLRPPLAS